MTIQKARNLEKPENPEFNGPPKMKAFDWTVNEMDVPPPDTDLGVGRLSRRARNSVNYALPNLRDKMRRDDKSGDPPKGEGKTRRRATSGGRQGNKDTPEELSIKPSMFDEIGGIFENSNLLIPPHSTLPVNMGEEPRKIEKKERSRVPEGKPIWDKNMELGGLPPSVMTHRRRRSSNLHQGLLMDVVHGGTNENTSQSAIPNESRRKTVSFDSSSTVGEGIQPRNRTDVSSSKRKPMAHNHVLPCSDDVVEEASVPLKEVIRSSRRITLGSAAKGIRGVGSHCNLAGGDEPEMDDERPTCVTAMTSRRRSMML